jgi:hypothetical protein
VLLSLLTALAVAADTTVEADRLVIEGDVARGEGHVRLVSGDDVVTGDAVTVDLAARTAEVTAGTWTRPSGTLTFQTARLDLAAGTGTLDGAVYVAGSLRIEGDSLVLREDGTVVGERVRATLCDCDGVEPWSVRASHVELDPGEVLRFRGAWGEILGAPILPVPVGSVPLARRSGLLAPLYGYGPDGVRLAAPLYLTMGRSQDATLTPEVRTKRSARLLTEHRYALRGGRGTTNLAGGWDAWNDTFRGGASWEHAVVAQDHWGAATSGLWTGDDAYQADYADAFLARQQPWNEARALAGDGRVEIALNRFQAPDLVQPLAMVGLHQPDADLGSGFVAGASLGAAVFDDPAGPRPWLGLDARLYRRIGLGPLDVVPQLAMRGPPSPLPAPSFEPGPARGATASVLVRLPMWREAGGAIERLEPTVEVEQVLLSVTDALDPIAGPPWAKPGLLWRRTRADRVIEARLGAVERDPTGWRYGISGWAQRGAWTARLDVRTSPLTLAGGTPAATWVDTAAAATTLNLGPVDLEAGLLAADDAEIRADRDVLQLRGGAGWTLPGPLSTVRIAGALYGDAATGEWLSRTVQVRWTHPTGCVTLGANARFDVDRAVPDFGLVVDVVP